ncbi:MAG: ABC transporter substrate-binding protein [Prevotella sp.]|nr:ABC transporter substrate-binding protein [Prevotella sp.]
MKQLSFIIIGLLLIAACGQSYEETKRITRQQRREAARRDSAALKVAVMPTLDCLPMYVAEYHHLFDTLNGGVRLKFFTAQMDCDTAMERGRVEGSITDLVRGQRMVRRGTPLRYIASTNAYWQLISNRNARIRNLKQLDDKMLAMTRYSVTDLMGDYAVDSARLKPERLFRVQINDVNVRLLMLQNNEMDALLLTEPQATAARNDGNRVLLDTRQLDWQMGVLAFRERGVKTRARQLQLDAFVQAYNQACDSINKYGVGRYRSLLTERYGISAATVDSLPRSIRFSHAIGPRQQDIDVADRWLKKK